MLGITSKIKKSWVSAFFLTVLLSAVLSGCLFPEEFEIEIKISKDGTFDFVFDGVLTYVLAKAEEVKTGKLSSKLEGQLKELEKEFKKDPRYTKVKYIGHAQYQVVFKDTGRLEAPYYFFKKSTVQTNPVLISIVPKDKGLIEVTGIKLDKKTIAQLEPLGMKVNGVLKISTDGEVIAHNAKSAPSIFGLFGSYTWEITSLDDPIPNITIKF